MSRRRRTIDVARAVMALALLIERQVGRPCPTLEDIVGYTTIPHRRVWWFVEQLRQRGLIEVEERGDPVRRQRRMRVFCGDWTDWTMRRPRSGQPQMCGPDGDEREASDDAESA